MINLPMLISAILFFLVRKCFKRSIELKLGFPKLPVVSATLYLHIGNLKWMTLPRLTESVFHKVVMVTDCYRRLNWQLALETTFLKFRSSKDQIMYGSSFVLSSTQVLLHMSVKGLYEISCFPRKL